MGEKPDSTDQLLKAFAVLAKAAAEQEPMPKINAGAVVAGLRSFVGTKGIGIDGWHPSDWVCLPPSAHDELALILNEVETSFQWPHANNA